MESRIEAIWAALDELAVALGDGRAVAAALGKNRELMLTYWQSFAQVQQAQPVPNGKPKTAPTTNP